MAKAWSLRLKFNKTAIYNWFKRNVAYVFANVYELCINTHWFFKNYAFVVFNIVNGITGYKNVRTFYPI